MYNLGGRKLCIFDRVQSARVPKGAFRTPNKVPLKFGLIDLNKKLGRRLEEVMG